MNPDDKKKVQRVFADLIVRYGAGAHYVQKFTSAKAWNLIAWVLIALGIVGWIFFLMWHPDASPQ